MQRVVWFIPVLISLHNAEEALAVLTSANGHLLRAPQLVATVIGTITIQQFLIALAIVTFVPFLALGVHVRRPSDKLGLRLLLLIQSVMFLNVFVHLGGAVLARGYTPGLVTALAINLPFSIFVAFSAVRDGLVKVPGLVACLVAAALLQGPGLLALLWLVGTVVNG